MTMFFGNAWMAFRKMLVMSLLGLSLQGTWGTACADNGVELMQKFNERQEAANNSLNISDKRKHEVLFVMGIILLIAILATAALGVSMVLFGKQVFVAHMICAGCSVFLSIAHAVTAIVWFFPYK